MLSLDATRAPLELIKGEPHLTRAIARGSLLRCIALHYFRVTSRPARAICTSRAALYCVRPRAHSSSSAVMPRARLDKGGNDDLLGVIFLRSRRHSGRTPVRSGQASSPSAEYEVSLRVAVARVAAPCSLRRCAATHPPGGEVPSTLSA